MSSVKIIRKDLLEKLAAKILLKTGKKITQQELLALCVQYSDENLDEFILQVTKENRKWDAEEIKQLEREFIEDFGEGTETLSSDVDKILYGDEKK